MRQDTQTQPALFASVDFPAVLEDIPADDCVRTWAGDRTIMFTRTSKTVKEVVDKMNLSVFVRLNRSFWDDTSNGTTTEKDTVRSQAAHSVHRPVSHHHTGAATLWYGRIRYREASRRAGSVPIAGAP
jgi:hypothetical protein